MIAGVRGVKAVRTLFQLAVIAAALTAGIRLATGRALGGVEKYCPFGGLETLWALVTNRRFSCAAGELNLALFLALLGLTLVARKSFCAWVCPIGAIHEWLAAPFALRRRRRRDRDGSPRGPLEPGPRLDRGLRWLRLPVLAVILYFTYRTGELIFRGYDPYYILFSAHGEDVAGWSYGILAAVLAAALVLPMAWCRYLCPLGAALWPLAAIGGLRIRRRRETCTSCGACDRVCPHGLTVARAAEVRSGECTLCLECARACPVPGTLALRAAGARSIPVPWIAVPSLVVLAVAGGLAGARLLSFPSVVRDYGPAGAAEPAALRTSVLIVDGLRCVDTAEKLAGQLEDVPGVRRLTAHASRNRAEIAYDPTLVDTGALRRAIEAPVYDAQTETFRFRQFKVVELDGEKVQ